MSSQEVYNLYLSEMGYSEQEVLSMHDPKQMGEQGALAIGALIGTFAKIIGSESSSTSDREYAIFNLSILNSNTNWLLREVIDARLRKRFGEADIAYFEGAFAGVFPTNDYNARVVSKYPGLILFDTACFELVEAFVWIGMWEAPYEERAVKIANIAKLLFDERKLPSKAQLDHSSLQSQNSKAAGRKVWISDITTATEEFILAHEYGHLTLHTQRGSGAEGGNKKAQEFEADFWAAASLLRPNSLWGDGDRSISLGYETQIAGICAALGIAHIMEVLAPMTHETGYPSAKDRLHCLTQAIGSETFNRYANWGLPFLDLASATAIFLSFGEAGFTPPQSREDQEKLQPLLLSA